MRNFPLRSGAEFRLLLRAWAWTAMVRVGLWTLPFACFLRLLERAARPTGRKPLPGMALVHEEEEGGTERMQRLAALRPSAHEIARAVARAARILPGTRCLTQACAARIMLGRAGVSSRLGLGVERAPGRRLRAHAWLECEGRVLLGGHTGGGFVALPLCLGAEPFPRAEPLEESRAAVSAGGGIRLVPRA